MIFNRERLTDLITLAAAKKSIIFWSHFKLMLSKMHRLSHVCQLDRRVLYCHCYGKKELG